MALLGGASRVLLVMLIACALLGLCQHVLVVAIGEEALDPETQGRDIPGHGVRSTDSFDEHLQQTGAEGEEPENSYGKSFVVESWRTVDLQRSIAKRTLVDPQGGSLSTSKRPPFPCNLPPGTCQATETCCASACVTVSSNRSHCGRCGHMCSAKRECCRGKCRRLATDEKNCGRCGARCPSGTQCLFGLCGYSS